MRTVEAKFDLRDRSVRRVVTIDELAAQWDEHLRFAVLVATPEDRDALGRLVSAGLENVCAVESEALEAGDVIRMAATPAKTPVLFRESDSHHTIFLTNQCNSLCLMCSQPPTKQDDSWLVGQALEIVEHIGRAPSRIGLTGGEPLLLGLALRTVLESIGMKLPGTKVDLLTNGRLLAQDATADSVLRELSTPVSWLVPLYGHADFLHDFIVQSPGSFEETIEGLLRLREHEQAVQLRIVLIKPVLEYLPALCEFIGRNLPFVREVALMACEPVGYALANRDATEVDLADWTETLSNGVRTLQRHRIPYIFMNTPLCSLPPELWPFAAKSISDWKNVYADECEGCAVKSTCSGLFAWHDRGWKPTKLRPVQEITS